MATKILVVTGLCLKIYNGGVGGQGGVLGDREKARDGWREGGAGGRRWVENYLTHPQGRVQRYQIQIFLGSNRHD